VMPRDGPLPNNLLKIAYAVIARSLGRRSNLVSP
jgi:hypothetical protein